MKKLSILAAFIGIIEYSAYTQSVTNVRFEQSGKQVFITYNLRAETGSQWEISIFCSSDGGGTWSNALRNVNGDVGKDIKPGPDKRIIWDVLLELSSLTGNISFKVKAEGSSSGGIEMVFVQGGTFQMGSKDGESDEKPVHTVTLSDFYIGKTEITQKQWRDIMGNNPSYLINCDNCPVEQVSWDDIQEFIQKLNPKTGNNYRLPTEAEWEYAARGGIKSKGYVYSGSNSLGDVAWFTDNSGSKTHPVGQKQPNEIGIYDMSGNVWEWCSDWYGNYYYSNFTQTNPKGNLAGAGRVDRGGSWNSNALRCRATYRDTYNPVLRYLDVGFRLVSTE